MIKLLFIFAHQNNRKAVVQKEKSWCLFILYCSFIFCSLSFFTLLFLFVLKMTNDFLLCALIYLFTVLNYNYKLEEE